MKCNHPALATLLIAAAMPVVSQDAPEGPDADETTATAADAPPAPGTPLRDGAWAPPAVDTELVARIVAGNLFSPRTRPDAPPPPPPEPTDEPQDNTPPPPPPEPTDPDARFALIGVSAADGEPVAFIEDTATGEVFRVTQDDAFSVGEILNVGIDGLTYAVEGEERFIGLGSSLLGGDPDTRAPALRDDEPGADSGGGGDAQPLSGPDARRAELLEQMRQRREAEQQRRRRG